MENNYNKIYALYDEKTIRVYQAYNDAIANEAVKNGAFGKNFKLERMTWIKPSFLWMMYRAGWGTKENQNRILAIDILREGFDFIVDEAVLSSYNSKIYEDYDIWKEALNNSEVRCQWDPNRNIYGHPLEDRAIQLGIKGEMVKKYVNEWIVNITDVTDFCKDLYTKRNKKEKIEHLLPIEKEYPKITKIMIKE